MFFISKETQHKEIYPSDYNYRSIETNKPWDQNRESQLQLYVTYKITIRNVSQSIINKVTEVVDFYDKDYTYRDDLSWVMYKTNSDGNSERDLQEINFTEADYYDTIHNLELKGNIADKNRGTDASEDSSKYAKERSPECTSDMTDNYQDVYIKGLKDKYLASGEEAYIYLTFQVNKDGDNPITLDNKDDPNDVKYNYAEINGVQTYYKDGTELPNNQTKGMSDAAGIIDINSAPGNLCKDDLKPTNGRYEQKFENDTDRSKGIKVLLDEKFIRSVSGTVWEDKRTKKVGDSIIGDGQFDEGENTVEGATVELVEKLVDPSGKQYEYVWETLHTKSDGTYKFENCAEYKGKTYIIPGNYIVRFHYGDREETVQLGTNSNKTSYNGQDFKTTIYQMLKGDKELDEYKGTLIDKNTGKQDDQIQPGEKPDYYKEYYDIKQLDDLSKAGTNLSDAKDLWITEKHNIIQTSKTAKKGSNVAFQGRMDVINYSNNNGNGVTNGLAEILASPYEGNGSIGTLIDNTQMTAETGLIILEGEYDRTGTDGYKVNNNFSYENTDKAFYKDGSSKNGEYKLENVDCGLTERPKAQLELTKKVTNVKITLANGNVLFDAANGVSQQDLKWHSGEAYEIDSKISNKKYNEYYNNNHRYYYRGTIDGIVNGKYSSGTNGFIDITMDEEIMHGATIRVSYDLTVTNVGEVDYAEFKGKEENANFYYKGTNASKVTTTSADVVLDYVANNLQFREVDNNVNGWGAVHNVVSTTGISPSLAGNVAKFNTVIQTGNLGAKLTPTISSQGTHDTKVGLILTQLITPENTADDKTYTNIAEITTISNDVGRRMAYSIQGNQDPTVDPKEVDSFRAERITILPPFGSGNVIVYIAVALGALSILTVGIIFIKKKVLKS